MEDGWSGGPHPNPRQKSASHFSLSEGKISNNTLVLGKKNCISEHKQTKFYPVAEGTFHYRRSALPLLQGVGARTAPPPV